MNCSPPGSSVYGIFQARILKWVASSFSRGSSQPRECFTTVPPGKPSPNPYIALKYSRISTLVSYQDLEGIFGFIQICLEPTDDLNWFLVFFCWYSVNTTAAATAAKSLQSCPSLQPHGQQPTRLPCPWDSPGKNTGVGCHFLLQ